MVTCRVYALGLNQGVSRAYGLDLTTVYNSLRLECRVTLNLQARCINQLPGKLDVCLYDA